MHETDEELMRRFGRGDAAAFEALYHRHEMRVFRYLLRSTRDHATASDVMQEVWFAVARNAQSYRPTAKFTTWLFTIAHNRMVDGARSRRVQPATHVQAPDDEEGSALDRVADPGPEPFAELQSQDEAAALLRAVAQLPAEQRSAFLMQAEGDLSVDEIAVATHASFETVRSRLRYARAKLRQLLWEYA